MLPKVTLVEQPFKWRYGWKNLDKLTSGVGHLDDASLCEYEALAIVNRWNSQQPGRWCYWLIGQLEA